MRDTSCIEIELDLRNYPEQIRTAEDYLKFWERFENGLTGSTLLAGKTHIIKSEQPDGKIGLKILFLSNSAAKVTKDTHFAVHSVLERPNLHFKCRECNEYGPFRCAEKECKNRICEQHAAILDGSMRAYCPEHVPKCAGSGLPATFWCDGPGCRGRIAWSDKYRVQHPNDPDHWYCPQCYALVFPSCSVLGCRDTGKARCEFIDKNTGNACDKSVCNKHVKRWQIYGPKKLGAALCPEHSRVKTLSEEEILYQMVAITAGRKLKQHTREPSRLQAFITIPSLMSIRHIFINTKNKLVDPEDIDHNLEQFLNQLKTGQSDKLIKEMVHLIDQSKPRRERDLDQIKSQKKEGQKIFNRLVELLRLNGDDILVQNLRFSDYKPQKKILFVYLEEQFRGRLIGRNGSRIKNLGRDLEVNIKIENSN